MYGPALPVTFSKLRCHTQTPDMSKDHRQQPQQQPQQQSPQASQPKPPWWQAAPFEHWVKELLIGTLVDEGDFVCELMSGRGVDTGKWQRARIAHYTAVEPQEQSMAESKKRWDERKRPFQADFVAADPYQQSLREKLLPGRAFDAVACFGKMQQCFVREQATRCVLANAARNLKSGGYFFGFLPDSSHIWTKAQKELAKDSGRKEGDPLEVRSTATVADSGSPLYKLAFQVLRHPQPRPTRM
jgi:SAM-dependent methyltransferase